MRIKNIQVDIVKIPFRKPFTMAMWTSKEKIHVVARITSEDGIVGIGESVPLVAEFGEPAKGIKEIIEQYFAPVLIGVEIFDIEEIYRRMNAAVKFHWFAKSTIDFAIYDLMGKTANVPLYSLLGGLNNDKILLNWVIGIQEPENAAKEAEYYFNKGYRSFKLKARESDRAINTLREVRAIVKDKAKIRIDANQSWSVSEAIQTINKMEKFEPELIEQPVSYWNLEGMAQVRNATNIPIMADEGVVTINDAIRAVRLGAADIINLKIAKSAGIFYSRKIADIAEGAGLECIIGSMLEGWIGTAASAHLAVSCKSVKKGCDLVGPLLHSDQIVKKENFGFKYEEGYLKLLPTIQSGLGVEIDPLKLIQYQEKVNENN